MQHNDYHEGDITVSEFYGMLKEPAIFIKAVMADYFRALKQYARLMTVLFILTVAVCVYVEFFSPESYEGKASYRYSQLSKKEYGDLINNIGALLKAHSYDRLENMLHLPASQLCGIKGVKGRNIYGAQLADDFAENRDRVFYVTVESNSLSALEGLDKAIENYLNGSIPAQDAIQLATARSEQAIEYGTKELMVIDSLNRAYEKHLQGNDRRPLVNNKGATFQEKLHAFGSRMIIYFQSVLTTPVQFLDKGEEVVQGIAGVQYFLNDKRCVKLQMPFSENVVIKEISTFKVFALGAVAFLLLSLAVIFFISICSTDK